MLVPGFPIGLGPSDDGMRTLEVLPMSTLRKKTGCLPTEHYLGHDLCFVLNDILVPGDVGLLRMSDMVWIGVQF